MDYEKLIERLNGLYTALREEGEQKCSPEINTVAFVLMDAASALSTLQAENESLRAELAQADRKGISPCTFCEFSPPSSGDVKPCCVRSACNYCIQYSYSKDCKFCPNCCSKMDLWDEEKENDS